MLCGSALRGRWGPLPIPKGKPVCRARSRLSVSNKVVLVPTGNGSTEHLGNQQEFPMPAAIVLETNKLYELGRAAPADLVIPIPTVSGRHAMIRVENDNSVIITDLQSTNGTFIEDKELKPMQSVPLVEGAEVTFGDKWLARFKLQVIVESSEPVSDNSD